MERKSIAMNHILQLLLIPTSISIAVTLFRLVGERQHWSARWFSPETGGVVPSGVAWVFGITWLAIPFGIYFAMKIQSMGLGLPSMKRAVGCCVLGLLFFWVGRFYLIPQVGFPRVLIFIWLLMAIPAALQALGWFDLFKTLLLYGLAARIPVVIVMFFAMRGHWGTHYDYVGMPPEFQMTFWRGFLWLTFFPQLIFWVGFTILSGVAGGVLAIAVQRVLKSMPR